MRRIAVKIGSNVLARPDGTLDITRMSALVDQERTGPSGWYVGYYPYVGVGGSGGRVASSRL